MGQCPGTFSEWVVSACRGAQLGLSGRDGVAGWAAGLAVPAVQQLDDPAAGGGARDQVESVGVGDAVEQPCASPAT